MNEKWKDKKYLNPYLAGVGLGITLFASYLVLGTGLGASGGIARLAAFLERSIFESHVSSSEYFGKWGDNPLNYYLVFMLIGVLSGSFISALFSKRFQLFFERGQSCSKFKRTIIVLIGGFLVGFASRLAQGCTSGQALSGGVLLLNGSLLFLLFVFVGGYAMAFFVRGQWND